MYTGAGHGPECPHYAEGQVGEAMSDAAQRLQRREVGPLEIIHGEDDRAGRDAINSGQYPLENSVGMTNSALRRELAALRFLPKPATEWR